MRSQFRPALGSKAYKALLAAVELDNAPNNHGDHLGSAYQTGWYGFVRKDLRTVLGRKVRGKYARRYCGGGKLRACRRVLASTLAAAATEVRSQYGTALADVRIRATGCEKDPICDQISFITAGAVDTPPIPWQDRPTFQQIVEIR